jgi:hypothetical protein
MSRIPLNNREFFLNNKQVFSKKYPDGRWMALQALCKAVIAGKADDWWVLDVDFDTGENSSLCPYCATGVDHPDNSTSPVTLGASGTIH